MSGNANSSQRVDWTQMKGAFGFALNGTQRVVGELRLAGVEPLEFRASREQLLGLVRDGVRTGVLKDGEPHKVVLSGLQALGASFLGLTIVEDEHCEEPCVVDAEGKRYPV